MRVLVATHKTQGQRPNDFYFVPEGELVRVGTANPFGGTDGPGGENRSLVGMTCHRGTTTMTTADWPGTREDYVKAYEASLRAAGFKLDGARAEALLLADAAASFPPHWILEYRDGEIRPRFVDKARAKKPKEAAAPRTPRRDPMKEEKPVATPRTPRKAPAATVQVFVATAATQGQRASDFHFAREGELLRTMVGVDREADPDGPEGTSRALVGMDSRKATTTFEVVVSTLTAPAFVGAFTKSLRAAGLDPAYATLDGPRLLRAAARFRPGDVVELRGTRFERRDPAARPRAKTRRPTKRATLPAPASPPAPVQGVLTFSNGPRRVSADLSPRMEALLGKVDAYAQKHPGFYFDVGAPDVSGATVAALLARDLIETWTDPAPWKATEERFYGNVLRRTHGSATRYRTRIFAKLTPAGRAALARRAPKVAA